MRDPVLTDLHYFLQDEERRDREDSAEEETPEDLESRARLSLLYAEAHLTTVPTLPFREWVREYVRRERSPEHQGGWKVLRRWQLDGKGGVECKELDEPTPNVSSWQRAQRGE